MNDSRKSYGRLANAGVLLVVLTLGSQTTVLAQVAPTFNRRVTGISLAESSSGGFDVTAEWRIDLAGTQAIDVQVGSTVELRIGGTTHSTTDAEECLIWDLGSGGGDCSIDPDGTTCGSATFGTVTPVVLTCDSGVCSSPTITSVFPSVPLVVEDEIMVILRPAPGAAPDDLPNDDDEGILTFGSWNRRLVSLEVTPASGGGPTLFDVTAQVIIEISAGSTVPLKVGIDTEPQAGDPCCTEACCCPSCSTECGGSGCGSSPGSFFDVFLHEAGPVGPQVAAGGGILPFVCTAGTCTESCASGNTGAGATFTATCQPGDCACHTEPLTLTWTGVTFQPGDEIMVILRPAPGALPELPGFEDDDLLIATAPGDPIPAASTWGMMAFVLAILSGATLVLRSRSRLPA